jgi:hypothetical protein
LEIGVRTFFGIVIFGICLRLFQQISFFDVRREAKDRLNLGLVPVFVVLGASLVTNFIEYTGIFQSRFLTWISVAALPCIGLAIQLTLQKSLSGLKNFSLIALIGMVAFALSVLQASKSSIFFFIFMVLIVNYEKLKVGPGFRFSPKFIGITGLMLAAGILIFSFIQNLKDGAQTTRLNNQIGQKYFGNFSNCSDGWYCVFIPFSSFSHVSRILDGTMIALPEASLIVLPEASFFTCALGRFKQMGLNLEHFISFFSYLQV